MEIKNTPQEATNKVVLANSEHIFVQSNDFVQAKYKDNMTFWEFLIFGKMCTMIDPADTDFHEYDIYIKDLRELLHVSDGGSLYANVLEAASRLLDKRVIVSYKDDTGQKLNFETNLIAGFAKPENDVKNQPLFIKLSFHPKLRPFLLQLKGDFTKFDLRNYQFLRSGTSIRLYHLLKQHWGRRQRKVQIALDELKEMLGVSDKYELYGHFKVKVLEEAQKKLSSGTDISFDYEEIKKGKKVTAIQFLINAQTDVEELPQAVGQGSKFGFVSDQFGVNQKVLTKLVAEFGEEAIDKAVFVTKMAIDDHKIKGSPAGFFVEAVRKGYGANVSTPQKPIPKKKAMPKIVEQPIDNKKAQDFEIQKNETLKRLAGDEILRGRVVEHIQRGLLKNSYNTDKSFEENIKNAFMLGAVMNIVKKIDSEIV